MYFETADVYRAERFMDLLNEDFIDFKISFTMLSDNWKLWRFDIDERTCRPSQFNWIVENSL